MRWLLSRFRPSPEAKLEAELRFHIESLIQAKMAEGVPAHEARRLALIEFGGPEQTREECRDVYRLALLDGALTNARAAFRFLRKAPGFACAVVLTLAMGVGANSAVFSGIDAVLLRPLPFPDGDQLVTVRQYSGRGRKVESPVAPQRLEDWNRLCHAFSGVTGYYHQDVSESSGDVPEKLSQALVAPRFLRVLGSAPVLGRDFTPEEEHFGGPAAVLISYRLWQNRFHGDASVIGRSLHFGQSGYPIVGVLPAGFAVPDKETDVWVVSAPEAPYAQSREDTWFFVLARLKPGLGLAAATADLRGVQAQLGREFPKTDANLAVGLEPLKNAIVGESSESLWLLFGSVTLLLLIACSNIAALLLARTTERVREISIRYSLGASRRSVIAQLLSESLLLALLGSLAGLLVAAGATAFFRSHAADFPRVEEISLNLRIVAYTLGCALVCTLLFGLAPALQATRRGLAAGLSQGGRSQVSSRSRLQWTLVGLQITLAVALLTGAALLIRSFAALGRVSPGFDPAHVLTLRLSGSWGETVDMKALNNRVERDLEAVRGVPGVAAAATSSSLPGLAGSYPLELMVEGHAAADKILSDAKVVSNGYFHTLRIPILAGQDCPAGVAATAIVNRSFADAFLSKGQLLGTHLAAKTISLPQTQVIGLAGNAHENGLNRAPAPTIYWCVTAGDPSPWFLIRTQGAPAGSASAIRKALHAAEPARSVFDVMPLEDRLSSAGFENRFRTLLLSLFALTAILLAAIGLYGTLSYLVTLRRREIGLRLALGAVPSQILRRFLGQGLAVTAFGCLAGLVLAGMLSGLLRSMLFGVTRADLASYGGATLVVLLAAATAAALPAAGAARLDPMRSLREE